jgi:hypothetical protein
MNSCESPRPRLFRFLDLPDQGFMVVPLPTVRPTTSSMEPASTATVEPASTTVKSAATAPCATHHGAGMETPSSRSRPVIDAVGITAPGYIVRAVPQLRASVLVQAGWFFAAKTQPSSSIPELRRTCCNSASRWSISWTTAKPCGRIIVTWPLQQTQPVREVKKEHRDRRGAACDVIQELHSFLRDSGGEGRSQNQRRATTWNI